jgi:tetratricopeptide (TPR) repeat protein
MNVPVSRLLAGLVLAALPLGAAAQTMSAYTPPTLIKQGGSAVPAAGAGDVTVQVFVKKDGTFEVVKVIKTSNAADNAAALEVAKASSYKPGLRDGKAVDAYYDFIVKFAGAGVATGAGSNSSNAAALDLIRNGKYDAAKTQLTAHLATNPSDTEANTLLGVADSFLNDPAGASAAFDKVSPIPPQYKTLAQQSYGKYASQLLDQQKYADAIVTANKVLAIDPNSIDGLNTRGLAELNQKNYSAAVVDLQKARTLASASKADSKTMASLELNLAFAEFSSGAFDAAVPLTKDVVLLDPSKNETVNRLAANSYIASANDLVNAGKNADAVARLEAGAAAYPADAATLYTAAATILANDKAPDWKRVKAEADKALAADPSSGHANYIAGLALANTGDVKGAQTAIGKAKASPVYASDTAFAKQVDDALKKLSANDQ